MHSNNVSILVSWKQHCWLPITYSRNKIIWWYSYLPDNFGLLCNSMVQFSRFRSQGSGKQTDYPFGYCTVAWFSSTAWPKQLQISIAWAVWTMCLGYTSECNSGEVDSTEKFLPGWQNSEISTASVERQDTNVKHDEMTQLGWGFDRGSSCVFICVYGLWNSQSSPCRRPHGRRKDWIKTKTLQSIM